MNTKILNHQLTTDAFNDLVTSKNISFLNLTNKIRLPNYHVYIEKENEIYTFVKLKIKNEFIFSYITFVLNLLWGTKWFVADTEHHFPKWCSSRKPITYVLGVKDITASPLVNPTNYRYLNSFLIPDNTQRK